MKRATSHKSAVTGSGRADTAGGKPSRRPTALRQESAPQRFERIYRELREHICLLHYLPGTVLSEKQLADKYGVSRTPVRRVLQRLSFDGLIDIKNGVGNIVTEIDVKTFKEVTDLRMGLAELMGRQGPTRIPRAEIERAEVLLERARALHGDPDFEEYASISNEFAEVLSALIANRALREMTDMLHYRVARTWFSLLPSLDWDTVVDALEQEIGRTLDAMKQGDMAAVGEARRHFIGRIMAEISRYLTDH